jgi:hypothetical protein
MTITISAVAFKEGDAWVIQGIEHDIVAHTYDVHKVPEAFTRALLENVAITEHLGRKPLEGIKPAPEKYRKMFEDAALELRPTKSVTLGPEVSVRLAEMA